MENPWLDGCGVGTNKWIWLMFGDLVKEDKTTRGLKSFLETGHGMGSVWS